MPALARAAASRTSPRRRSANCSTRGRAACIACSGSALSRSSTAVPAPTTTTPRRSSTATGISIFEIVRHAWGIKLEVHNAPASAFVDGQMIRGIKEHLFAVLRDVVFISNEIIDSGRFDLTNSASITNAVFHVVRNARLLDHKARPNLVVCWGGHSIGGTEYQYTKKVGYEMGLRALDVCTGCGPWRDEGPDEGRDNRSREAAYRARPLHRHHRARHHRVRAAESDREPTCRSCRTSRNASKPSSGSRTASSFFRAAPAPRRRSCTWSASC